MSYSYAFKAGLPRIGELIHPPSHHTSDLSNQHEILIVLSQRQSLPLISFIIGNKWLWKLTKEQISKTLVAAM